MTEPTKPKRKYTRKPPGFDHQSKEALLERQHKRRSDELAAAKKYGFENISELITAIIQDEYILVKNSFKS